MPQKRVLVVCGTRPEGIKLAPVVHALERRKDLFDTRLCVTGQHREMLEPILRFFSLTPQFDLALMKPGQTLFDVTANAITRLKPVLDEVKPDVVLVQGDTTTAFAGALAAFYEKVKVGHVEAGLRTGNKFSPFPEEMNRVLVTRLADFHFAPTEVSRKLLEDERITRGVHVTGNTVTDALLAARDLVEKNHRETFEREFSYLTPGRRLVLVTGHRRESFGEPFENICRAIRTLSERFPDVEFVYPVHLNPNVRAPVDRILRGVERVHLIEPLDYPRLVYLLSRSTLVLTDSGGIQEEAPTLGKPVLVMREVTERPEGITAGCAELVGTDEKRILAAATRLLTDARAYESMSRAQNPYGDGHASERIVQVLAEQV
ncbi:MAG TPA: UDP-N-acetylglucosamine 2-epimerase (non-hydrolyzing) [Archangium sp.]